MKKLALITLLGLGLLRLAAGSPDTNSPSARLYAGTYSMEWSTNLVTWVSNGVTYIPGGYSEFVFLDDARRWWRIKPIKN